MFYSCENYTGIPQVNITGIQNSTNSGKKGHNHRFV
jgi:hypothetical protein